jgi:SOS-response transcriptional repressor LexA
MTQHPLIQRLKDARISHERIAEAIGRSQPVATRLLNGTRTLKAHEIEPLERLLAQYPATHGDFPGVAVPIPPNPANDDYEPVDILPTYAGLGGGGFGGPDEDIEQALVPRTLIQHVLRGSAKDFVLARLRGDSMEPDFRHDDQVLVDKRDCVPTQPGPFLLWDGDGFVMKNIERIGRKVRIFSTNPKYTEVQLDPEEETIKIVGRPSLLYARVL